MYGSGYLCRKTKEFNALQLALSAVHRSGEALWTDVPLVMLK